MDQVFDWQNHFDQSLTQDSFIKGREPCPFRIMDDCGGAFAMGVVAGSIWHFGKGCWQAPRTQGPRTIARLGLDLMKQRAPTVGGSFAIWGFSFSLVECCMIYYRKRDDWLNAVLAGGVAGSVLAARAGRNAMIKSGITGAALLGFIELGQYLFLKYSANMNQQMKHMEIPVAPTSGRASYSRSDLKNELAFVPDLSGGLPASM
eukprot:NODE_6340_length_856_cov_112.856753_g6106_i0.p1 GENE.NODE_6340_length_856_cov_112.856753_g6106_i0~~NODE_6340_length_856_cov_112.856753_g6106_i0.p1  ORF type:complete len:204 (-),score=22.67 NODE_6340_length_856_cov_112.856753_g6106_i0:204-815(-)